MDALASLPLAPLLGDLRSGRIAAADLARGLLDRMAEVDGTLLAFLPEPGREERLEQELAVTASRESALLGLPVAVKDVFHVAGLPTRAGSALPPEALTGPEASLVRCLREHGATVLGKTATAEFALLDPPATRNPRDRTRTPGGSSSGSAAAVAAGLAPLALGTQTSGSVLRPAAYCGIVGFKPSYGRLPIDGVALVSPSVDTVGFFSQDLPGMIALAELLFTTHCPVDGPAPRIAAVEGKLLDYVEPAAREAFEADVDALAQAGFTLRRLPFPEDPDVVAHRHWKLVAHEMAREHAELFATYGPLYRPVAASTILEGREFTAEQAHEARAGCAALRDTLNAVMEAEELDLWLSPSAPGPAPRGQRATGSPALNLPWTHAGLPAVSLPGRTLDGLPLGLQCVGRFGEDERLLAQAESLRSGLA